MIDTAELERLSVSITQGTWRKFGKMTGKIISEGPGVGTVEICETGDFLDADLVPFNADRWNADARAIDLVPDLMAEVIALRAEVERLREALQPFGDAADHAIESVCKTTTLGVLGALAPYFVTWRDFNRARAAHPRRVNAKEGV